MKFPQSKQCIQKLRVVTSIFLAANSVKNCNKMKYPNRTNGAALEKLIFI